MTTPCPDLGRLRSWLDREAAPANDHSPTSIRSLSPMLSDDAVEAHTLDCEACQQQLGTLQIDADFAQKVLSVGLTAAPSANETEAALARLHAQLAPREIPDLVGVMAASTMTDAVPAPFRTATAPATPSTPAAEAPAGRVAAVATPVTATSIMATHITATDASVADLLDDRPDVVAHHRRVPMPITAVWQRGRIALAGLAAAVAISLALATPEGQAMAATFLAQFRSQRLAIVTFDPNQTRQTGLFRLERLGTVQNKPTQRPAEVANVQEAASKAGFQVLQPDPATLPAGAVKTPQVRFSPATETRLTFDKQKTREYFDSINRKDLSLPDKLNGATMVVALPPIVMLEYRSVDNKPAVMVGQAREVQVGVEGGASLDEVRKFLLGMPDLPPDLARQLSSIQDWTTTLPIPVPIDKMTWQETQIGGAPGYILNDNTGLGSAVIWQKDGRIIGVAGPMKATELRRVAESLR